MITYHEVKTKHHLTFVKLDGRIAGRIEKRKQGFQYIPKGMKTGGEIFPSLEALKKSLEAQ